LTTFWRSSRAASGHFRIAPAAGGFVVSVFLPGEPVQRIVCATPGIANRVKSQISDAGLTGYIEGAL